MRFSWFLLPFFFSGFARFRSVGSPECQALYRKAIFQPLRGFCPLPLRENRGLTEGAQWEEKRAKPKAPIEQPLVPARGGCRRLRAPFPPRGKGRGDRGANVARGFRSVGRSACRPRCGLFFLCLRLCRKHRKRADRKHKAKKRGGGEPPPRKRDKLRSGKGHRSPDPQRSRPRRQNRKPRPKRGTDRHAKPSKPDSRPQQERGQQTQAPRTDRHQQPTAPPRKPTKDGKQTANRKAAPKRKKAAGSRRRTNRHQDPRTGTAGRTGRTGRTRRGQQRAESQRPNPKDSESESRTKERQQRGQRQQRKHPQEELPGERARPAARGTNGNSAPASMPFTDQREARPPQPAQTHTTGGGRGACAGRYNEKIRRRAIW